MNGNLRPWATRLGAVGLASAGVILMGATGASAQEPTWTNCGDYICTTYYTREATRELKHTLEDADYLRHENDTVICVAKLGAGGAAVGGVAGAIAGFFGAGGIGAVPAWAAGTGAGGTVGLGAGGMFCGLIVGPEGSDQTDLVSDAVAQNACYQYEYPAGDPNGARTGGITNDEGWCFD